MQNVLLPGVLSVIHVTEEISFYERILPKESSSGELLQHHIVWGSLPNQSPAQGNLGEKNKAKGLI